MTILYILIWIPCCLFLKGDMQSQAAVRAIARQVCEQLIQSEYILCTYTIWFDTLLPNSWLTPADPLI